MQRQRANLEQAPCTSACSKLST